MNQPLKSFKETHGCNYGEFAKRHGLHRDTIRWRWANGHRSLERLKAQPLDRLAKVDGKTFEQWSAWFAIRGIEKTAAQIRASWHHYQYKYKLSDVDALSRVKAKHGL